MQTVGAYEAKTHLAQLLDAVERGEMVTITRHGVPVAMLVPPTAEQHPDVGSVIAEIKQFRRNIRLGDDLTIRDLVEEGRR